MIVDGGLHSDNQSEKECSLLLRRENSICDHGRLNFILLGG